MCRGGRGCVASVVVVVVVVVVVAVIIDPCCHHFCLVVACPLYVQWYGWDVVGLSVRVPAVVKCLRCTVVVFRPFPEPLGDCLVYVDVGGGRVAPEMVSGTVNRIYEKSDGRELVLGVNVGVAQQEGVEVAV